mmetsp:Transcript_65570/g.154183  ORF Transcript_65570/g.154183 Transcript_65570/m.154183 type:complete len:305 (+) Transcript_65570:50-964(+)
MPGRHDPTRLGPSASAVAGAGTEQVRQLYYSTSTGRAYGPAPQEARDENFIDVHCVGQRTGKYMKYQKKRAPLLDRSSVGYYTDYVTLPLDDFPVTRALAKENKLRSNPRHASTSAAKFDDRTTSKDALKRYSRKEASRARQKSAKPKAGRSTAMPSGDLLEKRSVTHQVFGPPHRGFKSEPAVPPRPNLFLAQRSHPPSTNYRAAFTDPALRPKTEASRPSTAAARLESATSAPVHTPPRKLVRCQSAPAGGRKTPSDFSDRSSTTAAVAPRPASAIARLQVLLCRDEEIYKVRRACYLSPGQ